MAARSSAVTILARRFLLAKTSDGFLSFIAWVSVVGVALGVLALVVVTSVINGFEGDLVRVITGMNGDVVLYSRGEPIADPAGVERRIRSIVPEAERVTASFVAELMISGPDGVSGGLLEGVDLNSVGTVTSLPKRVTAGRLPAEGERLEVALGDALAEKIGAKLDEEVKLIAPFAGGRTGESAPKVVPARVVGLVKMGMHEYDSKFIFASMGAVQRTLEMPGRATSFKIALKPGTSTRAASDRLAEGFGYPFRAKDWGQLNKNLLYAIRLEKVVISILLTAIVIVAAFNVVSTLMMMIHDKSKEIAILKAMGLRPSQSFRLFVGIGMAIGATGVAAGVGLGLGLNELVSRVHLVDLPSEIYYLDLRTLPVVTHRMEIALIAGLALLITFAATLYPAYQVSTRPPAEGLRYD